MSEGDLVTVGAAAAAVGVTVRTLHHWQNSGLIAPSYRTDAGYRLFTSRDVARIRRVKLYRDLGVRLADIGTLLEGRAADRDAELRRRRAELHDRIAELQDLVDAVDDVLAASKRGPLLTETESRAVFGEQWDPDRVMRAAERWSDSPQWAEYAERAATRTKEEWRELAHLSATVEADLLRAMRDGVQPDSARAEQLADSHRRSLNTYFHCTIAMHALIGRMFVEEQEYAAHFDAQEPGFARWLSDVIGAHARRHGVDPETAVWE